MPTKRPGVLTGVPTARIVKASKSGAMSQHEDAELAALEAELNELEQEQVQDQAPEAVEAAAMGQEEEQEDIDAALAALAGDLAGGEEDEESGYASAGEALPEPATDPEPEPAGDAAAAEEEEEAPAEEASPAEPAEEEPAPPSAAKKPAFAPKRKGLVVAKAAGATAVAKPAKPATGTAPVLLKKKKVVARSVPAAEDEAAETDAKENEPTQPGAAAAEAAEEEAAAEPAAAAPKPAAPKPASKPKLSAAPKPKAVPKPAAPKPAAAEQQEAAGPKVKRNRNAYMFYVEAARAQVKADHPELGPKEIISKLGELYKAMSEEERAPYQAKAAEDKERYAADLAALGPEAAAAQKKPKAAAAKHHKGVKGVKTAYNLFCDDRLPGLKAENPKAGMTELAKLLSAAWKDASADEKEAFQARSKNLKAAAMAAAAAAAAESGEAAEEPPAAPAGKKRGRPAGSQGGGSKKRGKKAAAEEEQEEEEPVEEGEEDDDEQDRLNCDWEAHPAERILSHTRSGYYVVLRQGRGLEEYGLVSMAEAKAQRLGQASTSGPCPVSLDMITEYEGYRKAFDLDIHSNTERDELVLDDLATGTTLEACFFLGQMRREAYELDGKRSKKDVAVKFPLLATCRVVQRMLVAERQRTEEWRQRALAAEGELVGGSGDAKVGADDTPNTKAKKAVEA